MQSMAQNDFPLLSHPFPLPLFLQSEKHHKEFVFIFITQYIFFTSICLLLRTLFQKFIICSTFVLSG